MSLTGFSRSAAEQEGEEFCWAAVLESLFAYRRFRISQQRIMETIRPGCGVEGRGCAATLGDMVCASNRYFMDERGRRGLVIGSPFQSGDWPLLADLLQGWPAIAGVGNRDGSGHVVMVTGADYGFDPRTGRPVFLSLEVFDPAPDEGERTLDDIEVEHFADRLSFLMRVRVSA